MKEVDESAMRTIDVERGEIYHIKYTRGYKTDISNLTDGDIYISNSNNFEGKHIVIPSYSGYNGLKIEGKQDLYIKADAAGRIALFRLGFI